MRLALLSLAVLSLAACTTETADPTTEAENTEIPSQPGSGGTSETTGTTETNRGGQKDPAKDEQDEKDEPVDPGPATDAELNEVVYVLMRTRGGGTAWCSGTLVASNKVVTAGHCLENMRSFEVVAPFAPNKPRVTASSPRIFGDDPDAVENPDIGILTLDQPITLPAYGELTDVVAQVEAKTPTNGVVMIRTSRDAQSPLRLSAVLPLRSTVDLGYAHGFGAPLFSGAGDSGAGMFLVHPNGKRTHKFIAVVRNPEPARNVDHLTRIDAAFLTWYAANK